MNTQKTQETKMIEITTRIKATGLVDQALLDHLRGIAEGKFFASIVLGMAKPENAQRYENTQLELIDIQHSVTALSSHTNHID